MDKSWLLITTDFPPRYGGVARYYHGLARTLPGIKVLTDVLPAGEDDGDNIIRRSLFSSYFWPKWLPLLWLIPYYKLTVPARFCGAGQILPVGTALWLINLAFGWPYWVFVHGYDLGLARLSARKRFLARKILQRARLVVANSEYTRQLAMAAGAVPARTLVVYPSSDLDVTALNLDLFDKIKTRAGGNGQLVVLTVARLVKRKNVASVIKVVSTLGSEFANLRYVVIGDGPELDALRQLAGELKVSVVFTGEVSDVELVAWYNLCDVFVLVPINDNTDIEGFGIVYLEAQAIGKPVIGSLVGGVPEAVAKAGYLVSSQADLQKHLGELLRNVSLRRQFGKVGRQRVALEFNWSAQAAKLADKLYD